MTVPDLSVAQWLWAIAAALCVGLGKAGFAGIGLIAILLMAMILPARESTGTILPLLIVGDLFAVYAYRHFAKWKLVFRLLPPAVTGVLSGWFLMPIIPRESFGQLIGWITLALLVLVFVQKANRHLPATAAEHPGIAWPFGWLAGTTTMIANAAGPVMSIYLLACRLPKMEFVATAAWFFFIVNVIKIPFSISLGLINPSSLSFDLLLVPGVVAGVLIGRWLIGKINQSLFEWLMIIFSLAGALKLILLPISPH